MLLNGVQTNPDLPGVEKMVTAKAQTQWMADAARVIPAAEMAMDAKLVGTEQIFMIKGWNRSVVAIGILYAIFCHEPEGDEGENVFLEAGSCVYMIW